MVEGGSSSDFRRVKTMLYDRPDLLHRILSVTTDAVIAYLNAQIESGAQAVMIFDSWGGALSAAAYQEFSLQYMQRIVAGLIKEKDGERVPSIVFTKGGGLWLESIAAIGCDAIGVDWTIDIGEARRRVGDKVALQGNLDPNVLFASPERNRHRMRRRCSTAMVPATRVRLQPRPRHFAIHAARSCDGAGRRRAWLPQGFEKVSGFGDLTIDLCTESGFGHRILTTPSRIKRLYLSY